MIDLNSSPKKNERVIAQESTETLVLLNVDSGEYYTLNEVGMRVWELCDGEAKVSEMVAIMSNEYDVSAAVIEADILELLEELASEKLIVETNQTI
jgi:hypothetical protein